MNFVIIVACLIATIAAIYFGQKLLVAIAQKQFTEKQKLISQRKRLHLAVGQMLAKANEIDERSRFQAGKLPSVWSKQLADACNQLVGLSSALKELEADREEPGKARNNLLRAINVANTIESSLRQLESKLSVEVEKVEDSL